MPRFSLKDVLRGITLASIGFGMLAAGFNGTIPRTSKKAMLVHSFLVAFGGTFVGYGLAFSIKYPPHQMILAMLGMFAATSWDSGSSVGLLVYVVLMALLACVSAIQRLRAKRGGDQNNSPSAH